MSNTDSSNVLPIPPMADIKNRNKKSTEKQSMYLQLSRMANSISNIHFWRPEQTGDDIVKRVTQGGYCSTHSQTPTVVTAQREQQNFIVRSEVGQNLYSFQSTTKYFKSLTRSYGRLHHGYYYYLSAQVTHRGVQVQSFLCLTTILKRYEGESPRICTLL